MTKDNEVPLTWCRTPEWMAWQNMRARCHNQNLRQYKDYGGRGIKVCDQWQGKGGFKTFLNDVGFRPSEEYTLDRIDNALNYEPGNVRWATRYQQNSNTRKNIYLTANGKTQTISQWSRELGIPNSTLTARYNLGWTAEDIINVRVRPITEVGPKTFRGSKKNSRG